MVDRHKKRVEHRYTGTCCDLDEAHHRVRVRTGDRHSRGYYRDREAWRNERGYYQDRQRKRTANQLVLCLDGEGKDIDNDPSTFPPDLKPKHALQLLMTPKHVYTLLAASDATGEHARSISALDLSTEQCLEWLLDLPPKARKVAFSFGYDVNMILRDVPIVNKNGRGGLRQLWDEGFTYWRGYRIAWTPHKVFSVSRGSKNCVVWDMFGYFQASFAKTIHAWGVGTHEERVLISEMKAKRAGFAEEDENQIRSYCLLECRLGAEVFSKLMEAVDAAGLRLQRYDGAGSVAAAMLRKHGISQYLQEKTPLPESVSLSAYYGGRFDHTAYGEVGSCREYDINSAYPYQALSLPCLAHSNWREASEFDPTAIGVWHVQWNLSTEDLWSPFPYRIRGRIQYLRTGAGWYYGREVESAIRLYPGKIQVMGGYVLDRDCEHVPFGFIDAYYQERKRLKDPANYSFAEKVLKSGLNSLYGKTAQNHGKHVPRYQQFVWAGMITSNTRAMLLDGINQAPRSVVLVATDALVSKAKLDLQVGEDLGEWERKVLEKLFIIQNGVYIARGVKEATRGYNAGDIDFSEIRRRAKREPHFKYTVPERHFVGLGEGLAQSPPLLFWRRWLSTTSQVTYGEYPSKVKRDGRLFPADNPRGFQDSDVYVPDVIRRDDIYPDVVLDDWESLDALLRPAA